MIKNKNYWFRARKYGWGWTPNSWEGWTVAGLYFAIVFFLIATESINSSFGSTIHWFFPSVLIVTGILLLICFLTGEKPHWQWGEKKK